jgi:aspartate aminotransferase
MAIAARVRASMDDQSWVRRMFELGIELKRQHGEEKVFDLSLGNPILEPPEAFVRELRRLAEHPEAGMHRYMPNAGYPETRQAVADHVAKATGLPFGPGDMVMTCGAGGALNVIFKAILDPGDEVLVFTPYFPEYRFYADNHGGVLRTAPTDDRFQPDLDALEALLTPRTRAVLVNSPNNPSGAVYSAGLLERLGRMLAQAEERHGTSIYLVGDEPYARLVYDGLTYSYLYRFHRRSIVATSFSKDLSLPGERIGYIAVGPDCPDKGELVDALVFCNRVLGFVNAPALMQWVIRGILDASVDIGWYQRKRDYVYDQLTSMGYELVKPQGAFFAFPSSPIPDDVAFVRELLQWNVLVTPGTGFGRPGFVRISYCVEDRVLEGAMEGFREAARAHGLRG